MHAASQLPKPANPAQPAESARALRDGSVRPCHASAILPDLAGVRDTSVKSPAIAGLFMLQGPGDGRRAERDSRLSPPPTYARDGGLRQAPGHAAKSSAMTKHSVVIAGGGPTGLMLAA